MTEVVEMSSALRLPLCTRDSSLKDIYGLTFAIRTFEQSLLNMFEKGALAGTTHTCLGQEGTAVGVVSALDRQKDIIFSNHRGHGHFLAYCGEVEKLYLEVMGKPGGVCAGRGGSQHLHHRNFYSNGIQGGIVPVTVGMAVAEKQKESGAIAVVFLGDGTLGEGAVYEAFNIASLWKLPVLFIIENNGYAQSTPYTLQVAGSISARTEAFGIATSQRATTNAREVLEVASQAVDEVRSQGKPHCLVLRTYRLGPHSKGDDDRDEEEMHEAWQHDPLKMLRPQLDEDVVAQVEKKIESIVEQARTKALAADNHET
ncbi:MAG: thiamine pyrophosphate-dependent dehydrogenase E1 component subunit alpha [Deltaproteobacteria bacterium]